MPPLLCQRGPSAEATLQAIPRQCNGVYFKDGNRAIRLASSEIVMLLIHFHPSRCRDFKIYDAGLLAGISCRIEGRLSDAEILKQIFYLGKLCSLALFQFLHGLNSDGIRH